MGTDTFPYRFTAAEGMYKGTTFVYLDGGTVVSYATDSPASYFQTGPDLRGDGMRPGARHEMTPEALARFSAIPERES